MTNPIFPCLWFDGNAAKAAKFYCSVFRDAKITAESPILVNFELAGQKFMGLNGGSQFKPNPSISFFVVCEDVGETNEVWSKLSDEGSVLMPLDKYEWSERYGWVQDRFGVSWQVAYGKLSDVGQKFTPSLMFTGEQAGKAREAIHFYTSVFPGSSIQGVMEYSSKDPDITGTVKHAQFILGGGVFMAMDSSLQHDFKFEEGLSLVIDCKDQEEVDYYWDKLTADGEESMCGWLKDRYGVSWQVVPVVLGELMSHPQKGQAVMNAFLKMRKFDIPKLMEAYERG